MVHGIIADMHRAQAKRREDDSVENNTPDLYAFVQEMNKVMNRFEEIFTEQKEKQGLPKFFTLSQMMIINDIEANHRDTSRTEPVSSYAIGVVGPLIDGEQFAKDVKILEKKDIVMLDKDGGRTTVRLASGIKNFEWHVRRCLLDTEIELKKRILGSNHSGLARLVRKNTP